MRAIDKRERERESMICPTHLLSPKRCVVYKLYKNIPVEETTLENYSLFSFEI
jgi:hypothetical protein